MTRCHLYYQSTIWRNPYHHPVQDNDVQDELAKIVICLFNVNLRLYIIRERKKEGGKSNAVTQKWKTIKNHYKHILIVMEVSWSRNRAVDILVYNNNSLTITYIFCFYISVEKVVGMTWLSGSCMTDQKMSADQKLIYCNDSWVLLQYLLLPKSSLSVLEFALKVFNEA